MPRHFTTEVIHLVRKLVEKYRERKMNLCMVFIDLKKIRQSSKGGSWRLEGIGDVD